MKELKSSELSSSFVVCGGEDTPIGQHTSNTQTIWLLSAGNKKYVTALKDILWKMAESIPYSIPGIDSPHNLSKNTGSELRRTRLSAA
jgi:hypothetical protein